jgi:hypothetical protein
VIPSYTVLMRHATEHMDELLAQAERDRRADLATGPRPSLSQRARAVLRAIPGYLEGASHRVWARSSPRRMA